MVRAPGSARAPLDLSLYLVTDTAMCGDLGVAATATAAVAAGVSVVQLRDPDASDSEFVALGRSLVSALEGTGVPVIVNDRVELVQAIGAEGAHVGQGDLDVLEARRMLGSDASLGLSVQTTGHVRAALALGPDVVDYLGVGPVWATPSKPDAAPACGLDGLEAVVRTSPWPCVAIGGIDGQRIASVAARGVAGVAVISAICGQPDVGAAARALRSVWERATPDDAEPLTQRPDRRVRAR